MSKTLGIILTVAAVAFAIAVPVFGLAALGLTVAAAAAISAGLSAAIMINGLLMPKGIGSANLKDRQASATTLQLGEVPRVVLFGEAAIAGSLVDAFNYGGDYATDWEVVVIALADHKSEGLTGFYVNDTFVTFAADGVVAGYNSQLEVYFRSGDAVQTLPTVVTAHGPGWTSSDYGSGISYVVVAYKADAPDQDVQTWPGGRPRFLFKLKGKRCYNPRKDSTVAGGSGSHRWATPSTWEWSNNPIVCRYNWARGIYAQDLVGSPDMLLVGRGLSDVEQPPANLFAPANLCDELVGGVRQFQIDGSVYSSERFLDVEERFASAVGGIIVTREGAVEIEPAQAKAVAASFTDDDLLVGGEVQWNKGFLSDADTAWTNTVIPRYIEPEQKWRDHSAPVRRDTGDIAADHGPREETVALDLVIRAVQAGVVGEIHRRLGRLWGRGSVPLGPRFAELEEGDWIEWTSDRHFDGDTKTFRIDGFGMDEKWQSRHQLREIDAGVYDSVPTIADGSTTFTPTPGPTLTAPAAGDWVLAATTIDGVPALSLTGAVTMSSADAVVFEHRVYTVGLGIDDNWVADGIQARALTTKLIGNVAGGTQYQVSVRYRLSGSLTPRRLLGPVTTSAVSVTALIDASTITGLTFSVADNGDITVSTHQRVYADKTVTVNGATVPHASGAAAGDVEAVYYDQQSRNGGTVSYQVLRLAGGTGDLSPSDCSPTNPYRHQVCVGHVPVTGGTTSGGSGTGTGTGGTYSGGGRVGQIP